MLRLVLLSGACLAVIGLVMATADPEKKRSIEPREPSSIVEHLEPAQEKPQAPSASELAPDSGSAPVLHTQSVRQTMPGPALRPSPQYPDSPPVNTLDQPAQLDDDQRRVTGDRINMRAGPGTSHAVIGSLSAGDVVTPLGAEADGWIQVRTANGTSGYIAGRFLSAPEN